MATISSVGLGSGLDVKSIVSQLVALEKQPLVALQTKEAGIQTKIADFAQVKSLVSTFSDAASKLSLDSGWDSLLVTSSNTAAVTGTVSGIAAPGNYSFTVSQLAQSQTSASAVVANGASMGGGTITLQSGTATPVTITIADTDDSSLTGIAARINNAGAGIGASVITDSTGQRLVLRSSTTGAASGFTISTTSSTTSSGALGTLAFSVKQAAQDTMAQINGVDVTSANRDITTAVPGMTFTASQVTTSAVDVTVTADTATTKKNIQAFVDAFNAANDYLANATKYDSDSKTAGDLQADSTAVGLQNSLRALVGSVTTTTGAYSRLSDIGITVQRGGDLQVDATKLDKALATTTSAADVKSLFATSTAGAAGNGIAVKFKALTDAMLSYDGTFNMKSDALALEDKRNLSDQDKVNARATALEARLNAQYSALDTQMASLNSLSAYVSQQVTNWNKGSG